MSDRTNAGSQAGQQGSGSQAGQGNGQGESQSQAGGEGSQEGQSRQEAYFNEQYMLEGETVEQALGRLSGALSTARKQAAGYRQRLGEGSGSQEGQSSQHGEGEGRQNGNDDVSKRLATLERQLADERKQNAANKTRTQLIEALASEGAVNPTRAVRMIDFDTLDIADDGTITDPLGPVRTLRAEMPQIFTDTVGNGDGGAGNFGSGSTNDMNALIRQRARR